MASMDLDAKCRKAVPCNGCTACCQFGDMPMLQPELWPRDQGYKTITRNGKRYLQLKDNGDCIYLGETGCTIHETRPHACRPFDCLDLLEIEKDLPQIREVIPARIFAAAKFRIARA